MKLFFVPFKPEEFDNTPYRHCHAMSILLVCDIKRYITTLYRIRNGNCMQYIAVKKEASMSSPSKG